MKIRLKKKNKLNWRCLFCWEGIESPSHCSPVQNMKVSVLECDAHNGTKPSITSPEKVHCTCTMLCTLEKEGVFTG